MDTIANLEGALFETFKFALRIICDAAYQGAAGKTLPLILLDRNLCKKSSPMKARFRCILTGSSRVTLQSLVSSAHVECSSRAVEQGRQT